jgi:hypothetical protein
LEETIAGLEKMSGDKMSQVTTLRTELEVENENVLDGIIEW